MKKTFILLMNIFLILGIFLAPISCLAFELNPSGGYPRIPLAPNITSNSRLADYVLYFFAVGVYIAGALTAISLAISGIQLMMSAENPDKISSAKSRIRSTFIGLFLVLGAFLIGKTINPQFIDLGITLPIIEPAGLYLRGSAGRKGAPIEISNLSEHEGYDYLYWPETRVDINGRVHSNCDPDIHAYMVYFYERNNLQGPRTYAEIKCGDGRSLQGKGSYIAVAMRPGVYFYGTERCSPGDDLFNSPYPQSAKTEPDPNLLTTWTNANIRSMRIINGKNPNKGPFFGVFLFREANFVTDSWLARTTGFSGLTGIFHFDKGYQTGDQGCSNIIQSVGGMLSGSSMSLINFGSALIYKKPEKNPDGGLSMPGGGITFYQSREKGVGTNGIFCPPWRPNTPCMILGDDFLNKMNNIIKLKTSEMPVDYFTTSSPKPEERALCPFFDSSSQAGGATDCFKSMKIDPRYIVVLSEKAITLDSQISTRAEAFPKKDNPSGPPDLNQTNIKPYGAKYITIVPIAEPLWKSN